MRCPAGAWLFDQDRLYGIGQMRPARLVWDLDNTIIGFNRRGELILNRPLVAKIRKLKAEGHTTILWTFGNRNWWRAVRRTFPELLGLFDEIYSRDELRGP